MRQAPQESAGVGLTEFRIDFFASRKFWVKSMGCDWTELPHMGLDPSLAKEPVSNTNCFHFVMQSAVTKYIESPPSISTILNWVKSCRLKSDPSFRHRSPKGISYYIVMLQTEMIIP